MGKHGKCIIVEERWLWDKKRKSGKMRGHNCVNANATEVQEECRNLRK